MSTDSSPNLVFQWALQNLTSDELQKLADKKKAQEEVSKIKKQNACSHDFVTDYGVFGSFWTCKKCGYWDTDI